MFMHIDISLFVNVLWRHMFMFLLSFYLMVDINKNSDENPINKTTRTKHIIFYFMLYQIQYFKYTLVWNNR
jgi:hypothetical protein